MRKNIDKSAGFRVYSSPYILALSFAEDLVKYIREASKKQVPLSIALSGGSTPELLYTILAEKYSDSVDWRFVHFFWGDERCVPPEDPESNFGMAHKMLLERIGISSKNIHRIRGERDPEKEASRYSREIEKYVRLINNIPAFDIIILGLGTDGHTASIFPGNPELFKTEKTCVVAVHPVTGQERITITGKVINNAGNIFFLAAGKEKAELVRLIIQRDPLSLNYPAARIIPVRGKAVWLLDSEAGTFAING